MKKLELQRILDKVPDDYDIYFEVEIKDKSFSDLKYNDYDINDYSKRLYIELYK